MEEAAVLDDTALTALVLSGDRQAFAGIVTRYEIPLQRYLYRLTGDYELSRDLAQDTFIRAYGFLRGSDFVIRDSLRSWLYRIAVNNARKYFRRKKLIAFIPFLKSSDGARMVDETENSLRIEEVLLKLNRAQRECLVLHFAEGFKYREIAGILGISEEAVRKRVARGSREFRRLYSSDGEVR